MQALTNFLMKKITIYIKIFKLNKKLNDIKRLGKVKDYTNYTFNAQITLPFLLALHCQ